MPEEEEREEETEVQTDLMCKHATSIVQRNTIEMPPETITVSTEERARLLRRHGWRQRNVSVVVHDFLGTPMMGHQLYAEFRSGQTQNTNGGPVRGGVVNFPSMWLMPSGAVRFIAVRVGIASVSPSGVQHYNLPRRGALRFHLKQQKREVTVTATSSREAAQQVGAQGRAGIDFSVISLGGSVSSSDTRTEGRQIALQWKLVLPLDSFEITQL